jgi:methyl-accepting chemotaxis protein
LAIGNVNEVITSTASAVEDQSIATSDMSTNVQRAATELAD